MLRLPCEPTLVSRARDHGNRPALFAPEGSATYADLLAASAAVARALLSGREDLAGERVAFLVPPGLEHVTVQWGIWRAGGIAVPMAVSHPPPELAYILDDADPCAVVVHPSMEERVAPAALDRGIRVLTGGEWTAGGEVAASPAAGGEMTAGSGDPAGPSSEDTGSRPAMMLYTSGTTGRAKGVVLTHGNLEAQVKSLVTAWGWVEQDHILLVLPLHHVHGIVNVLTCALWSGARCTILPGFHAAETWDVIGRGDLTLFMAVPTVYARLLAAWEAAPPDRLEEWGAGCRQMRLMVSGSAALPVRILERWREVSGHTLLERYGMTEIGMALSNPLEGERRPGFVGRPLPGVEVRVMGEDGTEAPPGSPGEIHVRGPAVFREYWRRPEETAAAFRDGWFLTGDVAVVEDGDYRILGRRSVDIIKTGGFKVSALEVEEVLRTHPGIADCAVVGVPDDEWGERVAAAVVPGEGAVVDGASAMDPALLRQWIRERLAPYKAPSLFLVMEELPRNAMGKVTKPSIRELFGSGEVLPEGGSS